MAVMHSVNGSEWRELDRNEMQDELEGQVQRLLGMSLEEFTRRFDSGDLPQTPAVEYLAVATGAASFRAS